MTNEERQAITDRLRALGYLGEDAEATPAAVNAAVARMLDERPKLEQLADLGRAYRAQLIGEALAQGRRLHGGGFDSTTYRAMLERPETALGTIRRMGNDWKGQADRAGRPAAVSTNGRGPLPSAAYG